MNAKKLAKIILFLCLVLTLGVFGLLKFLGMEPKNLIGRD